MPSWTQATAEGPAANDDHEESGVIDYNERSNEFHGRNFRVLDNCLVLGLDSPPLGKDSDRSAVRKGTIIVEDQDTRTSQQYEVFASHQVAIGEATQYTLLFRQWGHRLVLGERNDAKEVKKLCTLDFISKKLTGEIEIIGSMNDVVLI